MAQDPQEISSGQQPPQQGQSSEVVTSSSSHSGQQMAQETSSSVAHATHQQMPRGAAINQGQRRGLQRQLQRQPIVWDAASSRSQGAPSMPMAAARGLHGTRQQRGGPRTRRAGRGPFRSMRGGPRGGGI